MAKKPPPPRKSKPPSSISPPSKRSEASVGKKKETKSFSIVPLTGEGEGEKVGIYGKSGLGKTTLAAQAPNPVFIAVDDGARKIVNPSTGEPVRAITGIEDFDDFRAALGQVPKMLEKGDSLVIDTLTKVQPMIEQWVIDNIPTDRGGSARNLEAYGYGKGYRHVLDQMRLVLADLDRVVKAGINVILIMQLDQDIVPNPEGSDYYEEVPKLIHNKQGPVRGDVCEWLDHVLRIGYLDLFVEKDDAKARAGKVTSRDSTRAIYSGGAQHFLAKSRPVNGTSLPDVIRFESPDDSALWDFMFDNEDD